MPAGRIAPRTARLALVTPAGVVIGALPAFPVATPWWQDIGPVVAAARDIHHIDVVVLRLLEAERDQAPGGRVTYLAELHGSAPAATEPWPGALEDHPLRLSYARPGGPAADLAWAAQALADHGRHFEGRPAQIRTWNLSSAWRISTNLGAVWLKVTPPFLAHEGAALAHLAGEAVPILLAREGGRVLLEDIAGDDLYEAGAAQQLAMVSLLVRLQAARIGRAEALLALGLPDWRGPALCAAIGALFERIGDELTAEDRTALGPFVRRLPQLMADIAAEGIGDTLIHGDCHPGNFRGSGLEFSLLDWGDSGVGHPLLDQPAFLERAVGDMAAVSEHWDRLWREAVPGCDPTRAARLLAPVAVARQAAVYQRFLDGIEPSEHPYHRADPAERLRRTAALLRAEGSRT